MSAVVGSTPRIGQIRHTDSIRLTHWRCRPRGGEAIGRIKGGCLFRIFSGRAEAERREVRPQLRGVYSRGRPLEAGGEGRTVGRAIALYLAEKAKDGTPRRREIAEKILMRQPLFLLTVSLFPRGRHRCARSASRRVRPILYVTLHEVVVSGRRPWNG